jgi:hypothetical protein
VKPTTADGINRACFCFLSMLCSTASGSVHPYGARRAQRQVPMRMVAGACRSEYGQCDKDETVESAVCSLTFRGTCLLQPLLPPGLRK